ncbi:MAG: HesA/MoeB/ThiF family protein [Lentimicrobiaceae bacterium]|nr:HesA/MoeB/ThiF family protein [Lentimicrobiaceae bacterium]
MERYSRQTMLDGFGEEGQRKMAQASVLLVGVGGLGSAVSTYLTAAGIGKLRLVDSDTVSLHNLQRQVLYRENQVGNSKAAEAAKQLRLLNSTVEIEAVDAYFCDDNAVSLVKDVDIVVDATDNFKSRYLINDVCIGLDKVFVYGAISEFSGQLAVFNYKKGATYRCLFPDEQKLIHSQKQVVGVLGVLPAVIGSLQANEVIKLITHCGEILADKLFCINLQNNQTHTVSIPPLPENRGRKI